MTRDCPSGDCIVTAIANFAKIASDYHGEPEARTEALMFLVHLVADLHQPLHLGFVEDAGGNGIVPNTTFDGVRPQKNLHELWDYDIMHQHMHTPGKSISRQALAESLASRLVDTYNAVAKRRELMVEGFSIDNVEFFASQIATEITTTLTCHVAYRDISAAWIERRNYEVGNNYYRLRTVVILQQLMKASVRLVQLIEGIATRYYATELLENPTSAPKVFVVPTKMPSNRFAILGLEFDIDAHIYEYGQTDIEDEDDVDGLMSVEDEEDEKMSVSTSSTLTKDERKALKKQRAKELKKKAKIRAKNKQRRDRKKREAKLVEGVDLNSLVLIQRDVRYFITARARVVSPTFLPSNHIVVFVKFANQGIDDEPIGFLLDANVFPEREYTAGFLTRVFNALKGVEDDTETDFAAAAIDAVETFGSDKYIPSALTRSLVPLLGMTEDEIDAERDQLKALSQKQYGKKFNNPRERAEAEAIASREALRHLRRIEKDLILYRFESSIFVSTFSLCRKPTESYAFTLNKFSVMETKKSLRQHISLLVDSRVIDDKISDEMHEIIRFAVHSAAVATRSESLEFVNPGFKARIEGFVNAVYGGSPQDQIRALFRFRRFEVLRRPDKPYLNSIAVDLSIDSSRSHLLGPIELMMGQDFAALDPAISFSTEQSMQFPLVPPQRMMRVCDFAQLAAVIGTRTDSRPNDLERK